ncbi:uncharacterized protein LOC127737533 [Mytilus californianus]|uniref:uncharacterized protein LOC127737533 n=1 Tax=Mytilus californianus TaxID=6549 RepID=UPI0022481A6B|nr:uncharacterized protein LOC127737533 [Mytilus californianus]
MKMKYVTLICIVFATGVFASIVGVKAKIQDDNHDVPLRFNAYRKNHKSPCQENDCMRDNFACLPNSVGTLIGVCDDEVVNRSVNLVYYLQDGNGVQPFHRQLVLKISSPIYSIISAIMVQFHQNLEEEGILKGIKQDACKAELAIINLCKKDVDLNLTCLPDKTTCAIMKYSCIKSKDAGVLINTYNENTKKINEQYINIYTSWKYYSFFAKLLCEYENFEIIPRYSLTRQYRIYLSSNESNNVPSTMDKSDQVSQRITDGIIGFCICLGVILIVLCGYLFCRRRRRKKNQQQPIHNENSSNYSEMTRIPYSANTDDSSKDYTIQDHQDLYFHIGSTSA